VRETQAPARACNGKPPNEIRFSQAKFRRSKIIRYRPVFNLIFPLFCLFLLHASQELDGLCECTPLLTTNSVTLSRIHAIITQRSFFSAPCSIGLSALMYSCYCPLFKPLQRQQGPGQMFSRYYTQCLYVDAICYCKTVVGGTFQGCI